MIHLVEFISHRRIIRVSSQIQVEEAIFKKKMKRFGLVCDSLLFYLKILDQIGKFGELEEVRDLVFNRQLLLQCLDQLNQLLSLLHNPIVSNIDSYISVDRQISHQKHSNKLMASSFSGIHYRCYKAHVNSTLLSSSKCALINFTIANQTLLQIQQKEVSIILEKFSGNINIAKLRAILLLEVDFNTLNKIIFNIRVMPLIEANIQIPHNIVEGRRSQSSLYLALSKKLISNIMNQ